MLYMSIKYNPESIRFEAVGGASDRGPAHLPAKPKPNARARGPYPVPKSPNGPGVNRQLLGLFSDE